MKTFLKYICNSLEILCNLTHPFVEFEIRLTGTYCNLAKLSYQLDKKYNINVWKKIEKEERYYEDYPDM